MSEAPTLCQRCTSGREAKFLTAGAYMCESCYEEHRPAGRHEVAWIVQEHPEWLRGPNESSYDYGRRMSAIAKEMAKHLGVQRVNR